MGDFALPTQPVGWRQFVGKWRRGYGGMTTAGSDCCWINRWLVPERHLQRGFAGMLNHIDAVGRLVFHRPATTGGSVKRRTKRTT